MNKMQVLAVAVAVALTSASAFAQARQAAPEHANPRVQLDTNKDGVIDRAEAAKAPKLLERFDQLDKNKDGKLSPDERPHMGGKHRRGAMRGGHGRMMAMDADKDGRISRAEAMAAQANASERFNKMDVNKDGYLDQADRKAKAAQMRSAFFKGADANRDGRVTRDEFIVEQGARSAERHEKWAKRAQERAQQRPQAVGKQAPARQMPTGQQQIERAGKAFDRMDANRDGALTRAEFDAFEPQKGMRHGKGHGMGEAKVRAPKP
ncbi:MAG: calcium-binding protein [Thermomonas sp.]